MSHSEITRSRARRRSRRLGLIARVTAACVASLILIFPLYWMSVVALSAPGDLFGRGLRLWPQELTLANFESILQRFPVEQWFLNSVVIATFVMVLTVILNLLAGYAFAKLRFPGRNAIFLICLATMMIPVQAIMVAQFRLVSSLGLVGTYWSVILPGAAAAFGIFLARQFIIGIPDEILEAARIDGAGQIRLFLAMVVPLSRPLIGVLALMTFLGSWNDFAWPLIALKNADLFTLPIGLLYLKGPATPDFGAMMALALISVLPMVLLFVIFQKSFVQGFARSGIR